MFVFDPSLLPPSLKPVDQQIFHYTSAAGLLGMVENRVIWASEACSLNDRAEVVAGWELHEKWVAQLVVDDDTRKWAAVSSEGQPSRRQSDVYVACGSTAGDDVSQWRSYADQGSGYAIELDSTIPLSVWSAEPRVTGPTKKKLEFGHVLKNHAWVTPWLPAVYEKPVLFGLFDEVFDMIRAREHEIMNMAPGKDLKEFEDGRDWMLQNLGDDYVTAISTVVHLYKAAGYSGENEVRVVAGVPSGSPHLRFRAGGSGVVGYLPLTACSGPAPGRVVPARSGEKGPLEPLPIRGVKLGSRLGDENRTTVRRLLGINGLAGVRVDQSTLKMR